MSIGLHARMGRAHPVDEFMAAVAPFVPDAPRTVVLAQQATEARRRVTDLAHARGGSVVEDATTQAAPPTQTFDLLYLHAARGAGQLAMDLDRWLPLAASGAIVVVDAYTKEAVGELVRGRIAPAQVEGSRRHGDILWTRVRAEARAFEPSVDFSVIIPTYKRHAYVVDAVESFLQQTVDASRYEILVVDNESNPVLEQRLSELGRTEVRYVSERRVGLLHARHAGAFAARGRYLVYVDDDVLASPDHLRYAAAAFDDPKVAIVGGRALPEWEAPLPTWLGDFPPSYLSILDLGDEQRICTTPDAAYGCNMAIRRDALFHLGGFHPDAVPRSQLLTRGDGETGLLMAALEDGHSIAYAPGMCVRHRIPGARLTPNAMFERGLKDGLSVSYTDIRRTPRNPFFRLRVAYRGTRACGSAARAFAAAVTQRRGSTRCMSEAFREYGYAKQHFAALIDRHLRQSILEPTYLTLDSEADVR